MIGENSPVFSFIESPVSEPPSNIYQCPGEPYSISRAVHLGRLASFYVKCQECPWREDTGTLSPRHVRRLAEVWDREGEPPLFTGEGASGRYRNHFTPAVAGKLAAALGMYLRGLIKSGRISEETGRARAARPSVVVGCDARALSAEIFSAAIDGLRWADCDVVDAGYATAASLAFAIDHVGADGGLLVGNPQGLPHTAGLKFWGPGARPFSAGGSLDRVRELHDGRIDRPARRSSGVRSVRVDTQYLESLRHYFHALRPLKFVVDTTCEMLVRQLHSLCENVSVAILPVRSGSEKDSMKHEAPADGAARFAGSMESRLAQLGSMTRARQAHFGVSIEDDGEVLHVVDESGARVADDAWLAIAACEAGSEAAASGEPRSTSREETYRSLVDKGAKTGGDTAGRFWFADAVPFPDALRGLALLLTALSRRDVPLSEVVSRRLVGIDQCR